MVQISSERNMMLVRYTTPTKKKLCSLLYFNPLTSGATSSRTCIRSLHTDTCTFLPSSLVNNLSGILQVPQHPHQPKHRKEGGSGEGEDIYVSHSSQETPPCDSTPASTIAWKYVRAPSSALRAKMNLITPSVYMYWL